MYSTEKITITKCWIGTINSVSYNPIHTTRLEFIPTIQYSRIPSGIIGFNPIHTCTYYTRPELRTYTIYESTNIETKMMFFEDVNGKQFFINYVDDLYNNITAALQKHYDTEIIVNKILWKITSIEHKCNKVYNIDSVVNLYMIGALTGITALCFGFMVYDILNK
jgi:hypothetical protein